VAAPLWALFLRTGHGAGSQFPQETAAAGFAGVEFSSCPYEKYSCIEQGVLFVSVRCSAAAVQTSTTSTWARPTLRPRRFQSPAGGVLRTGSRSEPVRAFLSGVGYARVASHLVYVPGRVPVPCRMHAKACARLSPCGPLPSLSDPMVALRLLVRGKPSVLRSLRGDNQPESQLGVRRFPTQAVLY